MSLAAKVGASTVTTLVSDGAPPIGPRPRLVEGVETHEILLARDAHARPCFDLAIMLSRRPTPADGSIAGLIESGVLALSVQFARKLKGASSPFGLVDLSLVRADSRGGRVVATTHVRASSSRAALRTSLSAADASELLAALDGSPIMRLEAAMTNAGGVGNSKLRYDTPVAALARDAAANSLTILYPDPERPALFRQLEPLIHESRPRGATADEPIEQHLVAQDGRRSIARALALTPDHLLRPSAHALIAGDAIHRIGVGRWAAHDAVVEPPDSGLDHLPIVEDASAAVWPDRASAAWFYAPDLSLRLPSPSDAPDTSAFVFALSKLGAAADGRAALSATVRFTLDATPSAATAAALAADGSRASSALPLNNLSARLEVPFRDAATSELRIQSLVGTAVASGSSVVVTVEVQGDTVRLLYGALAYEGFQSEPARLKLAYAFSAYVPLAEVPARLAFVNKLATIPIVHRAGEVVLGQKSGPVFDLSKATVQLPSASFALARERSKQKPLPVAAGHVVALHQMHETPQAVAAAIAATPAPTVVVHPALSLPAAAIAQLASPKYAVQTIIHEVGTDVLYPCSTYGALYLQSGDSTTTPIGCSDVLKLGDLTYRSYDEIPDLRAPTHRVFRSLQQPGRFLILPTTYRITRYAWTEPEDRRGRPATLIYALVGDTPDASSYWFTATLQPDLSELVRARLATDLVPFSPHGVPPTLHFPTDPAVNATIGYSWAVPDAIATLRAESVLDSIQVSVSTGLPQGVVLKELVEHSGLRGAINFTLPEGGVPLSSELVVDTTTTGPWIGGPVTAIESAGRVTVHNAIAQPVHVLAVHARRGAQFDVAAVDQSIGPDEDLTIDVGGPSDAVFAEIETPKAATLAELGVFEEDVTTNVVFVNQVAFANHDLRAIGVHARVRGSAREYEAALDELATASLELVFPLTTYLDEQILEYRLTAIPTSGQARDGEWRTWSLNSAGNVVGITPDQVP